MDANVKNRLSDAINAMVGLAEASGTEVRMTFRSVAMAVKPGHSARELMDEIERNEKLAKLAVVQLAPLLMSLFSSRQFRHFCHQLPNSGDIVEGFPSPLASPKQLFEEAALLLCTRGLALSANFWESLEWQFPGRLQPTPSHPLAILPVRQRIMTELTGN